VRAARRAAIFFRVLRLAWMDDGDVVVAGLHAVDVASEFDLDANCGRGAKEVDVRVASADHGARSLLAMSSAGPSGPLARPWPSRHSARRIASGSAPCWTANENMIAASRALVSAAEFAR